MDFNQQKSMGFVGRDGVAVGESSLTEQYVRVYGWMFLGLLISGVVSLLAIHTTLFDFIFYNVFALFGLAIGELVLVSYLSARVMRMTYGVAALAFLFYSVLNGITLSLILRAYTTGTIVFAFFVSAAFFGFLSLYGIKTKQDLSSYKPIVKMALIGILLASTLNIFLASSTLDWIITYVGVALFFGLTAYDNQRIKKIHSTYAGTDKERNVGVVGALRLYLDFINIFLFVLRALGRKR